MDRMDCFCGSLRFTPILTFPHQREGTLAYSCQPIEGKGDLSGQDWEDVQNRWIPAFAGMTVEEESDGEIRK